MISSNTDTNTKKSSKSTSPVNNNSQETSRHTSITDDDEDEDEIKRYINKHNRYTIIAVFEGDYVRFSRELKNGELAEENIISQEEFEKMIEQEDGEKKKMSNNNNNTITTNNIINPNQCVYRFNTMIHWKYLRTPILKFLLKRNLFVQIDITKTRNK